MICIESGVGNPYPMIIFIPIRQRSQFTDHHSLASAGLELALCVLRSVFRDRAGLIDETGERVEVTSSSAFAEVLLRLIRAVKSSIGRTALPCSSAAHCSLVCERPGPCHRRAVFIGGDVAVPSGTRSSPPHRQGALVASVRQRRQPYTVGSIDQHEYSRYACRSKHFLFGPCVSDQRATLGSRWTHQQLGRTAQRLHV